MYRYTDTTMGIMCLAATILLILGLLLISSSDKRPFRKYNTFIGLIFIVLAILISLETVMENPGNVIMVFATLVLAGAASLSFNESRVLNNTTKQEKIETALKG